MKLFSENMGGNLHEMTATINRCCPEIIPGIVVMEYSGGYNSLLVYRAEKKHPFFLRPGEPGYEEYNENKGPT